MPADRERFTLYDQHHLTTSFSEQLLLGITHCPTCKATPGFACCTTRRAMWDRAKIQTAHFFHSTRINRLLIILGKTNKREWCRPNRFYWHNPRDESWDEVCPTSPWDNDFDFYTPRGYLHKNSPRGNLDGE